MPEAQRHACKGGQVLDTDGSMEVSEEVRAGAGRVFPLEPVRTLDALHLSTALLLIQAFPDLQMLTFDQRIDANSRALGMD